MLHFLITTALLLLGGGDLPNVMESGPNKIVDHLRVNSGDMESLAGLYSYMHISQWEAGGSNNNSASSSLFYANQDSGIIASCAGVDRRHSNGDYLHQAHMLAKMYETARNREIETDSHSSNGAYSGLEWALGLEQTETSCFIVDTSRSAIWLVADKVGSTPLWYGFMPESNDFVVTSDMVMAYNIGFALLTPVAAGHVLGLQGDFRSSKGMRNVGLQIKASYHWQSIESAMLYRHGRVKEASGAGAGAGAQMMQPSAESTLARREGTDLISYARRLYSDGLQALHSRGIGAGAVSGADDRGRGSSNVTYLVESLHEDPASQLLACLLTSLGVGFRSLEAKPLTDSSEEERVFSHSHSHSAMGGRGHGWDDLWARAVAYNVTVGRGRGHRGLSDTPADTDADRWRHELRREQRSCSEHTPLLRAVARRYLACAAALGPEAEAEAEARAEVVILSPSLGLPGAAGHPPGSASSALPEGYHATAWTHHFCNSRMGVAGLAKGKGEGKGEASGRDEDEDEANEPEPVSVHGGNRVVYPFSWPPLQEALFDARFPAASLRPAVGILQGLGLCPAPAPAPAPASLSADDAAGDAAADGMVDVSPSLSAGRTEGGGIVITKDGGGTGARAGAQGSTAQEQQQQQQQQEEEERSLFGRVVLASMALHPADACLGRARRGTVIVVAATHSYRHFLRNWLRSVGSVLPFCCDGNGGGGGMGSKNKNKGCTSKLPVLVVTADESVRRVAGHLGASSVHPSSASHSSTGLGPAHGFEGGAFGSVSYQRLMLARTRVVMALLRAGSFRPLVADIDAVWLNDPLAVLPLVPRLPLSLSPLPSQDNTAGAGAGAGASHSNGQDHGQVYAYDVAVTDDDNGEWCGCFVSLAPTERAAAFWEHVTHLHAALVGGAEGQGQGQGQGDKTMPSFLESEQKIISRLLPRASLVPLSPWGTDIGTGTGVDRATLYQLPRPVADGMLHPAPSDGTARDRGNSSGSNRAYAYAGLVVAVLPRGAFPSGLAYFNSPPSSRSKGQGQAQGQAQTQGEVAVVHCNYLVGRAAKLTRLRAEGLWRPDEASRGDTDAHRGEGAKEGQGQGQELEKEQRQEQEQDEEEEEEGFCEPPVLSVSAPVHNAVQATLGAGSPLYVTSIERPLPRSCAVGGNDGDGHGDGEGVHSDKDTALLFLHPPPTVTVTFPGTGTGTGMNQPQRGPH
jgi:hypothetical protein